MVNASRVGEGQTDQSMQWPRCLYHVSKGWSCVSQKEFGWMDVLKDEGAESHITDGPAIGISRVCLESGQARVPFT